MHLTIYTPSYNKGNSLLRTYESLNKQTNTDFEWLVINDGSTDNTDEIISLIKPDKFPWKYIKIQNSGLPTVMNLAAKEAKGDLLLRLDGDDYLKEDAVQKIYENINKNKEEGIGAFVFLTCFEDDALVGCHPFKDIKRCNFFDYRYKFKAKGDRAEVFKTEVFRKYPMPIFEGERFLSESYIWNKISDNYDAIYYPEKIYVRVYDENSLSRIGSPIRIKSPKGSQLRLQDVLNRPCHFKDYIKESINYYRYSLHTNYSIKKLIKDVPVTSTIIGLIPGYIMYRCERKDILFMKKIRSLFKFI